MPEGVAAVWGGGRGSAGWEKLHGDTLGGRIEEVEGEDGAGRCKEVAARRSHRPPRDGTDVERRGRRRKLCCHPRKYDSHVKFRT